MKETPGGHFRQYLLLQRQLAIAEFQRDDRPDRLLKKLCRNMDGVLRSLWFSVGMPNENALVAVGGYGRGELFPYSDVDMLVLLKASPDPVLLEKIEKLIQLSWDLGTKIGHSVRTVEECLSSASADVTVRTSLLESRRICGSRTLFQQLRERHASTMNMRAFFRAKMSETRQRHRKQGDTPFSLEPDCKESPGGLRDLQVILWLAKAAGLGGSWNALAKRALITTAEARQLKLAERTLKDIRIRLHIHAKRAENRLLFDLQIAVAESFHFKRAGEALDARAASELLMRRYYLVARTVRQLHIILLQNVEAWLFPRRNGVEPVNAHFNRCNDLLDLTSDTAFSLQPSTILEVFLLLAHRADLKGMTARTLRALWHARTHVNACFNRQPVHRAMFVAIFKAPHFSAQILQSMNEMGILGRCLPNFGKIAGQMQHDLFHRYTVDQHTLFVIANLHRFTLPECAHEHPLCSQLMAGLERPWLLYIAALFHDIAKGRGGDHALLGTADARRFCKQHLLPEEDTELVVFLVGQHLTLSHVAQKKDLSNPQTIVSFAALVQTKRQLAALYLLTVADIRGTNPMIWSAWKNRLLEDLYFRTWRVLDGEMPSIDDEFNDHRREALSLLRFTGFPVQALDILWKHMDASYFLRHTATDIAWHARTLYRSLSPSRPVVRCRWVLVGEGWQVMVYTPDKPDLFSRICAYFARRNLNILEAKIHTTSHQYALDTFIVTGDFISGNRRDIITRIEQELAQTLSLQSPLPVPERGRPSRESRVFPLAPDVNLQADAGGNRYILSVTANDRKGLLYDISRVLGEHHVNLHMAKITTLGERAEDIFLIEGAFLQSEKNRIHFETALIDALSI